MLRIFLALFFLVLNLALFRIKEFEKKEFIDFKAGSDANHYSFSYMLKAVKKK